MDLSASFSSFLAERSTDSTDIEVMGIANQFLLQAETPTLGGRRGSCLLSAHPWGQEGQEVPFKLNSFLLSYLLKGHFPAL